VDGGARGLAFRLGRHDAGEYDLKWEGAGKEVEEGEEEEEEGGGCRQDGQSTSCLSPGPVSYLVK